MCLHPDRGRLYQASAQGHLSGTAPRRTRHLRHDPQGRGHRAGDVRRLHPRLCALCYRPGPSVPHQGLHHCRGQPHQQGQQHRQPAAAGRGRKGHQHDLPVEGSRHRGRLCDHGHEAGPHQAHPAGTVCQHPQVRPDRHCPERGRCSGMDPPDHRPRYAHCCHPQRSGHPLQRSRCTSHGSQRPRRARNPSGRGR